MIKKTLNIVNWLARYPYYTLKRNIVPFSSILAKRVFLNHSKIGKYCYIGSNTNISYTQIGNYCCIASNVVIGGMEHPHWDLSMSPRLTNDYIYGKKTFIGNDVWIATGCIIKQGVTIGDGALIGAGSFVNKDVEPYSIVVGTPAVHLKYRDCKKYEEKLKNSKYWEYNPNIAKQKLNQVKND